MQKREDLTEVTKKDNPYIEKILFNKVNKSGKVNNEEKIEIK